MSMDGQGPREAGRRKRQMDKKTSKLGIFFAGNRLSSYHESFFEANHPGYTDASGLPVEIPAQICPPNGRQFNSIE